MAKLIELKEAAALLGVTPEELTELRSRSKIFGYRDGSTWKFKESELERYADQNGITLGGGGPIEDEPKKKSGTPASLAAVDADLEQMIEVDLEDDIESILVSENELGSGPGASSTIIGKEDLPEDLGGDLKLAAADDGGTAGSSLRLDGDGSALDLDLDLGGDSELKLASDSAPLKGSDLDLSLESGLIDGSDLKLSDGGPVASGSGASDFDLLLDGSGSELRLEGESGGGTGDLLAGSADDLLLEGSSGAGKDGGLDLGDDDLLLESSDKLSGLNFDESGIDLDIASGTDVGLIQDASGSDITLNAGDSGINLSKPSESGISLETESLELGGSGVEALELGEADIVDLDDADVDFGGATQLKADDDFLLSPVEAAFVDDADSGSQVIALDSEEFGDGDDSLLGAAPVMEVDEEFGSLPERGAGAAVATAAGGVAMVAAENVEAPYSLWNVLGLASCFLFLTLSGIMMIDLLRNMWSWNQPYSINSSLMDFIVSLFGK